MLAQGHTPAHIAKLLEADDPDFEYRQFGIIDRESNVFAHTGPKIGQWAGHKVGPYYAAYGNGLAGPQTVEGIVAGFMSDPDAPLEERLMRGIEGGRDAGGQRFKGMHRPERSAWLRVVDRLDWPEIDLRVDMHDKTVAELRRIFEEFKRYREVLPRAVRRSRQCDSRRGVRRQPRSEGGLTSAGRASPIRN